MINTYRWWHCTSCSRHNRNDGSILRRYRCSTGSDVPHPSEVLSSVKNSIIISHVTSHTTEYPETLSHSNIHTHTYLLQARTVVTVAAQPCTRPSSSSACPEEALHVVMNDVFSTACYDRLNRQPVPSAFFYTGSRYHSPALKRYQEDVTLHLLRDRSGSSLSVTQLVPRRQHPAYRAVGSRPHAKRSLYTH